MRQFYSPAQRIEIDVCPQSGGVWLDPGELAHMRLLYPSEDDRREATQQFFDEIMPVFGGKPPLSMPALGLSECFTGYLTQRIGGSRPKSSPTDTSRHNPTGCDDVLQMQVTCINNAAVERRRCLVSSRRGSMPRAALIVVVGLALGVGCGDGATRTDTNDIEESITIDSTNSGTASESPNPDDNSDETGAETVRLLPLSCFIGSSACDPRNGDGCDEGATCDFSSESQLTCFPPPNTAQLDAPCNNSGGPFVPQEAGAHRQCDRRSSMPQSMLRRQRVRHPRDEVYRYLYRLQYRLTRTLQNSN